MRTIETKVYSFNELSEEAKQKAVIRLKDKDEKLQSFTRR